MKIDAARKLVRTVHDQTGLPLGMLYLRFKKRNLFLEKDKYHILTHIYGI